MLKNQRHTNVLQAFLIATAIPAILQADCWTLLYGGVGGNPDDHGVYLSKKSSESYRSAANEVMNEATTVVWGVNAPLVRAKVKGYLYRNSSQIYSGTKTAPEGAGVTLHVPRNLYANGTYYLGPYQFGTAAANMNDHWVDSPMCNMSDSSPYAIHHYSVGNVFVAEKLTISGNNPAIWFLGDGIESDHGYVATTQMTADGRGATAVPTWTIIAGADKLGLSCTSCAFPIARAKAASASGCGDARYDVIVQADFGGLPSETFFFFIDKPGCIKHTDTFHFGPEDPSWIGYRSQFYYTAHSMCDERIWNMSMNERFDSGYNQNGSNWPFPQQESFPGFPNPPGYHFIDTYKAEASHSGVRSPDPKAPSLPNMPSCASSSATPEQLHIDQWFYAGSPTIGSGVRMPIRNLKGNLVFVHSVQYYLDHACPVSDELPGRSQGL